MVKVDPHAKDEGRRSNGSAVRVHTNGWTDGQTDRRTLPTWQVHYLPRFVVDNENTRMSQLWCVELNVKHHGCLVELC